MKERRFRGRTKWSSDHKWVYGSLLRYAKDTVCIMWDADMYRHNIEVIAESVGQTTLMTDCLGKEIYEGDIVSIWDEGSSCEIVCVVRYSPQRALYYLEEDGNEVGTLDRAKEMFPEKLKVIGNETDNPEILKRSLYEKYKREESNKKANGL